MKKEKEKLRELLQFVRKAYNTILSMDLFGFNISGYMRNAGLKELPLLKT
jgi:hypothetical protein